MSSEKVNPVLQSLLDFHYYPVDDSDTKMINQSLWHILTSSSFFLDCSLSHALLHSSLELVSHQNEYEALLPTVHFVGVCLL